MQDSIRHESDDLAKFVDNIRTKLLDLERQNLEEHGGIIELQPEANLLKVPKESREYKSIISKQQNARYLKHGHEALKPDHLLENAGGSLNSGVNMLEDLDITCYQRPWGKLEHELKINRAMHFVKREITQRNLSEEASKRLRILLVNAINKRLITKKADVIYDEATGELTSICNLRFDPNTNTYMLGELVTHPPVDKQLAKTAHISHVSALSPEQNDLIKRLMMQGSPSAGEFLHHEP